MQIHSENSIEFSLIPIRSEKEFFVRILPLNDESLSLDASAIRQKKISKIYILSDNQIQISQDGSKDNILVPVQLGQLNPDHEIEIFSQIRKEKHGNILFLCEDASARKAYTFFYRFFHVAYPDSDPITLLSPFLKAGIIGAEEPKVIFQEALSPAWMKRYLQISGVQILEGDKKGQALPQKKIDPGSEVHVTKKETPASTSEKIIPVPVSSSEKNHPKAVKITKQETIQSQTEKGSNPPTTTPDGEAIIEKPKLTLQIKMMGVISILFALTVSTIIFLATYFFKEDNRFRIMENSIKLVDVIGIKIQTDVSTLVDKGKNLASILITSRNKGMKDTTLVDLLLENDPHFLYIGLFTRDGEKLVAEKILSNKNLEKNTGLKETDVTSEVLNDSKTFQPVFEKKTAISNLFSKEKASAFALGIPAAGIENRIIIMVVSLDKIQNAFARTGIYETFFVNGNGIIVAHPDKNYIQTKKNVFELPIVKDMLSNPAQNGQISFKMEDGSPYLGSFKKIGFGESGIVSIVSEDKAFEEVYNIQNRNIYIMVIALCSALLIVFFFSKSISKPVLKLLAATVQIARGNFKININSTTRDEVGLLTDYFVKMGQGLEEREKVKSILGSMIDPVVVKEAMIDMAALKRGSEKEITAFFSDVAGFSTISEQLASADLAALLNEYLSAMTIILKKHDGVLDKYIGDAIVGIFNAPVDVENHCLKAAVASVEMIAKLDELRKYWTENNAYSKEAREMDVRIGLNTGLAKVGFMGTDALASYTMMGDTVNLAARLEAAGKDYGVNILISESLNSKISSEMFTRELDLVRVKGKEEPVKIFELISHKSSVPQNIADAAALYEECFRLYLKRDFQSAVSRLAKVSEVKGKKDKAAYVLLERCTDFMKNPPDAGWDGVFTRTHK